MNEEDVIITPEFQEYIEADIENIRQKAIDERREYHKRYKKNNADRIKEYNARYRKRHAEAIKAYQKAYRDAHKRNRPTG